MNRARPIGWLPIARTRRFPVDVVSRLRAAGCVFAEDEARLITSAASTMNELTAIVEQRIAGRPLEHILGWAEFCGLRIELDQGVFVPRRRTEFLVHRAITVAPSGAVVVDLCCGSGAVGAALAAAVDQVELYAVDIDPTAVRCARRNLAFAGAEVYEGDLCRPLPTHLRGRVDVLVCNAPYVPTQAIDLLPPEARKHEDPVALDGGSDGLDVVRRLVSEAPRWLAPGGHLLFEVSEAQASDAAGIVAGHELIASVAGSDDFDATVVMGRMPA